MTSTPAAVPFPVRAPERPGWHRAIYGSGYALVASSTLTSGIGFLYWLVAARGYDQDVVGENSALIYAVMFLAGIAQLNLLNVLIRFVPVAGGRAIRFVLGSYLVGGGLAGLVGVVFAMGAPVFSPGLAGSLRGFWPVVGFGAACAVWAVFVMQDGVLAAVRRARVVTLENGVFSVVKLGLVIALATVLPLHGIVFSWMIATALAVLATNGYLFARALPWYVSKSVARTERIPMRGVLGYAGGDYLGMLFWLACTQLLPVLVLGVLGARGTAVFAMVWTISYALYLIPAGMGQSLVAHTSADVDRLVVGSRGVIRRSLVLVFPAVLVLLVAAPWVLRVLGPGYVSGAWALRLSALSALPNVITSCAVSAARVRRRMGIVVLIMASISVLVVGLAFPLMRAYGLNGAGWALLIAQTVVAAGVLLGDARWLPRPIDGPFAGLRQAGLLRRVGEVVLDGLPGERWRIRSRHRGRSDSACAVIGTESGDLAVLKAVDTASGVAELRRQTELLAALHDDDRLGDWRDLAPQVLDSATIGIGYCVVESRLPGTDAADLLADPERRSGLLRTALAVIGELHRRSARPTVVDDELLAAWVDEPADAVRAAVGIRHRAAVDRVVAVIGAELRRRCCPVGWTHGDVSANNLLVDADGGITGVVDWGQADPDGLVLVDVAGLLLATESATSGRQLGDVLLDWLRNGDAVAFARLAAAQGVLGGDRLDSRVLLLLAWLRMVAGNLAKSPRYAAHPIWLRRNVSGVLRAVDQDGVPGIGQRRHRAVTR